MTDHSQKHCTLQAFNESSCNPTNLTDPAYAAAFERCETKNCTAAEQNGNQIFSAFGIFSFAKILLTAALTVTNAYALCTQAGGYKHINSTGSSTAARVSGTAMPTGNSNTIHNSTTMRNGTFMGTPAPFTGGSRVIKGCGAVVLAGLFVGGMAVAL